MSLTDRRERFIAAAEGRKEAMYRVALLMLRNRMDAQDAVSEALEATWRQIANVRDLNALPAYLMRSAINACHAVLRRRKRETAMEGLGEYLSPAAPETPVWMYLEGLPDKYRLPLLLRYSEDMTAQEIAHILRLPRGTVTSRLTRGLRMLKQQIEKEETGRG